MIKIYVEGRSLNLLEDKAKKLASKLNGKVATAINKTARATRDQMIEQVTAKFNISKRNANRKKQFFQSKKARATSLSGQVRLKETYKESVKYFQPRHTKAGTTFSLLKGGQRELISSAFMGGKPGKKAARLGGHVFIREKGAKRKPINKLLAMSPWGMYRGARAERKTVSFANKFLAREIHRSVQQVAKTL